MGQGGNKNIMVQRDGHTGEDQNKTIPLRLAGNKCVVPVSGLVSNPELKVQNSHPTMSKILGFYSEKLTHSATLSL